jgi:hypothetical protein
MNYFDNGGYVSMLNPEMFALQAKLLEKKDQQYDQGYSIALSTKDKYSQFNARPEDVGVRNDAIGQYTQHADKLVKEKYNGDWGAAAKEIASTATQFKQDPVWSSMEYANKQAAMEQELKARYGPNAIAFKSIAGKSVLGKDGKLLSPQDLTVDVQQRTDDVKTMNEIWSKLAPRSLSGTSIVYKNVLGKTIPVIIDANGREISDKMIHGELDNMMKEFKQTPNYQQRLREYTELGKDGQILTKEQADEAIKADMLDVGINHHMKQYDERWQPMAGFGKGSGGSGDDRNYKILNYNSDLSNNELLDQTKKKLKDYPFNGTTDDDMVNAIMNKVKSKPEFQNIRSIDNTAEERIKKLFPGLNINKLNEFVNDAHNKQLNGLLESAVNTANTQGGTTFINSGGLGPVDFSGGQATDAFMQTVADFGRQNGLSEGSANQLARIIHRSAKRSDELLGSTVKSAIAKMTDKEIGDYIDQYKTPDFSGEEGRAAKQDVNNMVKDRITPSQVKFRSGTLSGKTGKEVNEAYQKGKSNKDVNIQAASGSDLTGVHFMINNPDGVPAPADLDGIDNEYKYELARKLGIDEPELVDFAAKEIKRNEPIPGLKLTDQGYAMVQTPFKYEQLDINGRVQRKAYIGEGRQRQYITTGMIKQNQDFIKENFGVVMPIEGNDDDPYIFPDKVIMSKILGSLQY